MKRDIIIILIFISILTYGKNSIQYTVQKGDTLYNISKKFEIELEELKRANKLNNNNIFLGQKLKISNQKIYTVKKGDTLYNISKDNNMEISSLKKINGLDSNEIFPGDILYLVEKNLNEYIVKEGDSLWEISNKYDISIRNIKKLNNISENNIYPGQSLKLKNYVKSKSKKRERFVDYVVSEGETLSEIARVHNMTLKEIRKANDLSNNSIYYGKTLKVSPLGFSFKLQRARDMFMGNIKISKHNNKLNGDSYYYNTPNYNYQKSSTYFESAYTGHKTLYKHSSFLMDELDKVIDKKEKLSNKLNGWKIVIDPGHGGIDPGMVVQGKNRNGDFHVMEDEYVYDIALRIYILLKMHGADAILTVMSPNHFIRNANQTFVNEKNEVYNERYLHTGKFLLPSGYKKNIINRVNITKNFLGNQKRNTLFISLHADKSILAPSASSVWYFKNNNREDTRSKKIAKDMLPYLGASSYIKGEELIVLHDNPAEIKILVEAKNLAYKSHVWEIKQAKLRQKDSEKIVLGLLNTIDK